MPPRQRDRLVRIGTSETNVTGGPSPNRISAHETVVLAQAETDRGLHCGFGGGVGRGRCPCIELDDRQVDKSENPRRAQTFLRGFRDGETEDPPGIFVATRPRIGSAHSGSEIGWS